MADSPNTPHRDFLNAQARRQQLQAQIRQNQEEMQSLLRADLPAASDSRSALRKAEPSAPRAHGRSPQALGLFLLGWAAEAFNVLSLAVFLTAPGRTLFSFLLWLWIGVSSALKLRYLHSHALYTFYGFLHPRPGLQTLLCDLYFWICHYGGMVLGVLMVLSGLLSFLEDPRLAVFSLQAFAFGLFQIFSWRFADLA